MGFRINLPTQGASFTPEGLPNTTQDPYHFIMSPNYIFCY